jgi:hypothetical protein
MAKTLTIRVDDYATFVKKARAENRSVANFIETAVQAHIRETEFVDDAEMAEILGNERLRERLRQGSKDAKKKRGTLIG